MSGSPANSSKTRKKILEAVAKPPPGGDFLWDGKDEEERPLSREEMRRGIVKRGGRPRADKPKVLLSVRYSPEVVEYFRSTGKGWQTRMDAALRQWIAEHPRENDGAS